MMEHPDYDTLTDLERRVLFMRQFGGEPGRKASSPEIARLLGLEVNWETAALVDRIEASAKLKLLAVWERKLACPTSIS